jgi:RND family efflux transporter MFP subunit
MLLKIFVYYNKLKNLGDVKMKNKKILAIGIIVLFFAVVWLIAIMRNGKSAEPTVDKSNKAKDAYIPVKVMDIVLGEVEERVAYTGTVNAWHEANVSSETAGRVTQVNVKVGDYVDKGEVIARVDDEIKKLSTEQAFANYQKARLDSSRSEELFQKNSISKFELEGAQLNSKFAYINWRMTKRQLDDSYIKAPISGRIAFKFVDVGGMLSPGMPIVTIVYIAKVKITVGVAETDILKIAVGQKVKVTNETYSETFSGEVYSVGAKADQMTRSFPVEVAVQNLGERLKPGMSSKVDILAKIHKNKMLVPASSVLERMGDKIVFVVSGDSAQRKFVSVGGQVNNKIVIEDGLKSGEKVVYVGQENLSDGAKVKIVE